MAQAPVQPFSWAEAEALASRHPPPPVFLKLFTEFLRERVREGLTEELRKAVEQRIKFVVDEAMDALEAQIRTYHDLSDNRLLFDLLVRKRNET